MAELTLDDLITAFAQHLFNGFAYQLFGGEPKAVCIQFVYIGVSLLRVYPGNKHFHVICD